MRFIVSLESEPIPGLIVRRNNAGDGWNLTNPPESYSDIFDIDDGVLVLDEPATIEDSPTSIVDIDEVATKEDLDAVEALLQAQIDELFSTDAIFEAENKEGATIRAGQLVAIHSSGVGVVKASAANIAKPAVGFARVTTPLLVAVPVQTSDILELADWTNSIGTVFLTRGFYWADPITTGRMTQTAPTTLGQTVQPVGYAISPTQFDISIEQPLIL